MKTLTQVIQRVFNEGRLKPIEKIQCKKCGVVEYPKLEYIPTNNSFKATCKLCDAYDSFVKHSKIEVL